MEYQKIINLLDDTTTQPSKFRRRSWVIINETMIIVTLDLKHQWTKVMHLIIGMHTYLLRQL